MKTKAEWIKDFRKEAESAMPIALKKRDREDKSKVINTAIKDFTEKIINDIKVVAIREKWNNEKILNEILLVTYASYIVMLEYRNKVWPYEYMAFARRIGELWEPFCKLTFKYPIKDLKLFTPLKFTTVQSGMIEEAESFFDKVNISEQEKRMLSYYYRIPWSLVESGGIKLELDLHFEQNGIRYNCDFKSGFSSNEKGNTNRLLLVGSIYNLLGENEKTLLFVRQEEEQNRNYLQKLINSPYWECFCADECYAKMAEYTGFNMRTWLDKNVDWKNDISEEFRKHLADNNLLDYLTW